MRLESQDLEGITRVWDALNRSYQLCVSYEVTLVFVNSAREAAEIAPVDQWQPEYGVISSVEAES